MKKLLLGITFLVGFTSAHASLNVSQDVRSALVEIGFEPTSEIKLSMKTKGKVLQRMLRIERALSLGVGDINPKPYYSVANFSQNNFSFSCDVFYEIEDEALKRLVLKSNSCKVTTNKVVKKNN